MQDATQTHLKEATTVSDLPDSSLLLAVLKCLKRQVWETTQGLSFVVLREVKEVLRRGSALTALSVVMQDTNQTHLKEATTVSDIPDSSLLLAVLKCLKRQVWETTQGLSFVVQREAKEACIGPILYILYISRPYHVIADHLPSAHGYADDTQLYLSFGPNGRSSQDHAIASVEVCISDLIYYRLLINDSKTEFLVVGSRHQLSKIAIDSITVGDSTVQPLESVRNWGS
ncbi:hypothetical protein pdam_00012175, partial [Pocillopora damicornis]